MADADVPRADVIARLSIPDEIRDDMVELISVAPGAVWRRPAIRPRHRSMMSITMLAGLGRTEELRIHIGMGLDNGLSRLEVCEVLMQAGIYAGFPAAVSGFRVATEVFAERDPDTAGPPEVSFVHGDQVETTNVKSQRVGDLERSVWLKFLELTPDVGIYHTTYDPHLVLQRHGHLSDHYVFVIAGEVAFDREQCRAGSLVRLPRGATFGPIRVGAEGAEILEIYLGDSRPEPVAAQEWEAIKADEGIVDLPAQPLPVPAWFGDRTDT